MARRLTLLSRVVAALLSGLLLHLSLPPHHVSGLVWIALIPLLWAAERALSTRGALYLGLATGLVLYSLSLSWFAQPFGVAALAFWLLLALWIGLFAEWFHVAAGGRRWRVLLFTPTIWVGLEFFRAEVWWFECAWLTPGSALHADLAALQWASIIGVYGLSFVIVLVNLLVLWGLRGSKASWAGVVAVLGTIYIGGLAMVPSFQPGTIPVAAIQYENYASGRVTKLVAEAAATEPRFIVWPEGAHYMTELDTRQGEVLARLARENNVCLVAGVLVASSPIDSARLENCALVFDADGRYLGRHTKQHLIPSMEKSLTGFGYARREDLEVFRTSSGTAGVQICFDENFTDLSRKLTALGAEFFLVPSYDPAAWGDIQRSQHAALLPLRAVESRRWFVRAASSGPSQIIDPGGRWIASTPLDVEGILTGRIAAIRERTLYHRFGWLLPWLCLGVTVTTGLAALFRTLSRRRTMRSASGGSVGSRSMP